jgi:hypothetical protein
MGRYFSAASLAALATASPGQAEVVASAQQGFALRYTSTVVATPEQAWAAFVQPGRWWDPEHTYSGDAAALTLAAEAGGCFCEAVPAGPLGPEPGTIEHMRVIYAMPGRMLRMSGALGPLQSEALTGVLTVNFTPDEGTGGTQVTWEYIVGGYMRLDPAEMAPLVDAVLGQQHARFVALLAGG